MNKVFSGKNIFCTIAGIFLALFVFPLAGYCAYGDGLQSNVMFWLIFFISLSAVLVVVSVIMGVCYLCRQDKKNEYKINLYKNIPPKERFYYKFISNVLMQMKRQVGDVAFDIVDDVPGLDVNSKGKILRLYKDPSEVLTLLFIHYNRKTGRKVRISPLMFIGLSGRKMSDCKKNLKILKKYFK